MDLLSKSHNLSQFLQQILCGVCLPPIQPPPHHSLSENPSGHGAKRVKGKVIYPFLNDPLLLKQFHAAGLTCCHKLRGLQECELIISWLWRLEVCSESRCGVFHLEALGRIHFCTIFMFYVSRRDTIAQFLTSPPVKQSHLCSICWLSLLCLWVLLKMLVMT